ncbi:Nn.00g083780.m01.CDS01 [Neocucurbitaria sp. VM-36]
MIFNAYPEEQRDLRWVTVALTTIATLLLLSRITSTIRNRGWLGLEDAFVIAANVFLIILAACIYKSTTYGFGMKVVDIKRTGGNVTKALKYFWLTQSFYTLTNGLNKMAFLALYHRVFPMKRFRQACMVLMAISVGWTISYLFVCIFQCTPVPRVFDRTIPGTCINFFWHRWSNAVLNLLTDISIFILPMPVIFSLNMSTGSRIGLVVLFSMGFFICLTTALRMATLPLTLKTKEPTWESAPTNLWSFIEAATGVICACLISLRKTFGALWPKKWRSHKGTSSGKYQNYGSGPSGHGLGMSRPRNGTGNGSAYPLDDMKSGVKGKPEMYPSISPSESQERIIEGAKTSVHVTSSRNRSGSGSGSDDIILQGITVTTDVKVVRD